MFALRSLARGNARVPLLFVVGLAAACGAEVRPNDLEFRVGFACEADRLQTQALRLRVLEGGCKPDGKPLYDATLGRGEAAPSVERLDRGSYGIEAIAYAQDEVLASACIEVVLPRSEGISLKLRSETCGAQSWDRDADAPLDLDAGADASGRSDEGPMDPRPVCPHECADADPCTNDLCVNGACTHSPYTGARECDGIDCTLGDMCTAGVCSAGGPSDAACADDGNPCTVARCAAGAGCTHANGDTDGQGCNDNIACTISDVCKDGVCSGTSACPGSQVCSVVARMCVSCASAQDCDDLDPCTTDVCASGICGHTHNTAACDDGTSCTTHDVCTQGRCAGVDACPSGATCGGASCRCNDASETLCAARCINLANAVSDCGVCGRVCANGASCQNGACKPADAATACTAYRNADHDYLFCADTRNWIAARDRCRSFGLVLIAIDSQAENDFVRERLQGAPHWIGANDVGTTGSNCRLSGEEGSWYWVSSVSDHGSLFCTATPSGPVSCSVQNGRYQNWNFGEPNNGCSGCLSGCGDGQDCASIDPPGTWDDDSCLATFGYICETP